MAKTPTPAQLAARERFAAMARAGAFKKRRKNPDYPGRMSVDAHGIVGVSPDVTVELEDTRNGQRRSFTSEFFVDRDSIDPGWFVWGRWGGVGRGVGVVKRVAWPAGPMRKWPKITRLVQPGFRTKADAQLVADQLAAEFIRRANPLTRVKVKSPSMATGAPPSKRLTKRRKATAKAPTGYYANPMSEADASFVKQARARIRELDAQVLAAIDSRDYTKADKLDRERSRLWKAVDVREGRKPRSSNPITPAMPWGVFRGEVQIAAFRSEGKAKEYGQAYADAHRMPVGVKRIK